MGENATKTIEFGSGSELRKYAATVFVSYARADDLTPHFLGASQGWVSFFWASLKFALTTGGLHGANLWLDRYEIDPAEKFTDVIKYAVSHATFFVPVLSTNWVQREYCRDELEWFVTSRAMDEDRIVLVKKDEPPPDRIPPMLRGRQGYEFFAKEELTGKLKDFYWSGLEDKQAYIEVIKRIAARIKERVIADPLPVEPPRRKNRTVLLAAPADELRDAWQRLANDLEGAGFTVVPDSGRLPDTVSRAEEVIADALSSAEISIHFLGEQEGAKPGDSDETYTRLQLRLARDEGTKRPGFAKVLWAPKWLPERQQDKRDPFAVVDRYGGLQENELIYAEEVTDLSQWLRLKLDPPAVQPEAPKVRLTVATAADADSALTSALASRVQSDETIVQALFPGDPIPAHHEGCNHGGIIPWGEASREQVDTVINSLSPLVGRLVVLSLPGGNTTAKARFFRAGVIMEPIDQLPPSPAAALELLIRLGILSARSGGRS
jgi:hypothetical protein